MIWNVNLSRCKYKYKYRYWSIIWNVNSTRCEVRLARMVLRVRGSLEKEQQPTSGSFSLNCSRYAINICLANLLAVFTYLHVYSISGSFPSNCARYLDLFWDNLTNWYGFSTTGIFFLKLNSSTYFDFTRLSVIFFEKEILLDFRFHQLWPLLMSHLSFGLVGLWSWHSRAETLLTEILTGMRLEIDPEFVPYTTKDQRKPECLSFFLIYLLHHHLGCWPPRLKALLLYKWLSAVAPNR